MGPVESGSVLPSSAVLLHLLWLPAALIGIGDVRHYPWSVALMWLRMACVPVLYGLVWLRLKTRGQSQAEISRLTRAAGRAYTLHRRFGRHGGAESQNTSRRRAAWAGCWPLGRGWSRCWSSRPVACTMLAPPMPRPKEAPPPGSTDGSPEGRAQPGRPRKAAEEPRTVKPRPKKAKLVEVPPALATRARPVRPS